MKPEFNVTLDGTRLDGEAKGAVSGVRVFLTHSGASAFEIVIDDPELRWQAKPTFTECKEVQIELGVPGKMKKVFDGEVTAWRTELERAGPTVLVLRGMDRSHRLMRGHKTKTYAEASPIDCAQQIASAAGLTAKTSAGQPAPVKTFRIQANESDFSFLKKMADLRPEDGKLRFTVAQQLMNMGENDASRIAGITLDEHTVVRRSPDIEHERAVAIFDLLEENHFAPASGCDGPAVRPRDRASRRRASAPRGSSTRSAR